MEGCWGGAEEQRPALVRLLSRTAPAPTPHDLVRNIDTDVEFDFSSLKENTDLTGRLADPDLQWTAGSVPAMPLNEAVRVHASVGPTLLDSLGSPHSFVFFGKECGRAYGAARCTPYVGTPGFFGGEGGWAQPCTVRLSSPLLPSPPSMCHTRSRRTGIGTWFPLAESLIEGLALRWPRIRGRGRGCCCLAGRTPS